MICRKCGIAYDSVQGDCPSCRMLRQIVRERFKDSFPSGFSTEVYRQCENCGREVSGTLISLSDANAKLLGFKEYFLPDEHDCSQKSSPPI